MFRVQTQDDHTRKRRTTEDRCCQGVRGWRIPLSLQSAEVLSSEITCTKSCLRIEPGLRSPTAIRDVHNEILVKAKAAGELVPK